MNKFEHPIIIGAGIAKSISEYTYLTTVVDAPIVIGTLTWDYRAGNGGNTVLQYDNYTLNWCGLPNAGIKNINRDLFDSLKNKTNKPLIVSVLYDTDIKYYIQRLNFDFLEINCSCPNTNIEYNIDTILNNLYSCNKYNNIKIFLKMPKLSSRQIMRLSTDINYIDCIIGITTTNSHPFEILINNEIQKCGLSGKLIYPYTIEQVKLWRKYLNKNKIIIGCGGISTGKEIIEMQQAGANYIQVVSAALNNPARCVNRLLNELIELDYFK